MAFVERIAQAHADSEMEEGEIVDELDDLSDISSEEEFLLRQRLEVLENYNNVLGRTKKKRSSGINPMQDLSCDLSEISAAEIEVDDPKLKSTHHKVTKHEKQYSKPRRRKEPLKNAAEFNAKRKREHRKKSNYSKKKLNVKIVSESSDESEDEYRNKRKKLADAVVGHRSKCDTTTLSARLKKMLHKPEDCLPVEYKIIDVHQNNKHLRNNFKEQFSQPILESVDEVDFGDLENIKKPLPTETVTDKTNLCNTIDLSTTDEDDVQMITNDDKQSVNLDSANVADSNTASTKAPDDELNSDEDLEQLRLQVLRTKTLKAKVEEAKPQIKDQKNPSEDEDSDTAELRMICLKSALLKKAIEMKQKQKLQKRLSQSTQDDDLFNDAILYHSKIDSGNNTDIESVDMDMGSDIDEKFKESKDDNVKLKTTELTERLKSNEDHNSAKTCANNNKEEDLEEDEDLLRAKLLTSLSKNLPNLINPEILLKSGEMKVTENTVTEFKEKVSLKVPEEKRFIIKLGESDSEGEHEATKNLTKMHMKLSEQSDFQQKLDLFLKTTRMHAEKTKLPDVVQKQDVPKKPEKYVAKAVNHLPKSEQIEYKNLVRRMAELEKMKQSRQASLNSATQPFKDTLKPRNAATDNNIEEKISFSRKRIADESAKMLKLKEEETKLSQKYKIVATELHNLTTAITLNKKQQRAVQVCLTKVRQQHQLLIKSSPTLHSKVNSHFNKFNKKVLTPISKLQKENTPKDDYKNPIAQKTVKVSVVNDIKNETNTTNPRLNVEISVASNKKVIRVPSPVKDRVVEITENPEILDKLESTLEDECFDGSILGVERGGGYPEDKMNENAIQRLIADDYKSPLDALGATSWKSDPNAILCPFEVGGQCKDPDCKYLHTHSSEQ